MAESDTFRDRTRATRYQQRQQLPPNFATVLKEYTRELLREQPDEILVWSAQYFKKLALETDPMLAQQPPPEHYAPSIENPDLEMLSSKIAHVFASMGDGESPYLYVHIVKRGFVDSFGLTEAQALYILSCDFIQLEEDGTVDYQALARDCVTLVLYFQQSKRDFPDMSQVAQSPDAMVHGKPRAELEDDLFRVMRAADANEGLGRLRFGQYYEALRHAPIQLTQRDIAVLLAEAERTGDGFVEFKREVERAFEVLLYAQAFTDFDDEQTRE